MSIPSIWTVSSIPSDWTVFKVAYNPLAPDLAIEVLSPSNDDDEMRIKIANYLAVGTILWVIVKDLFAD